MLWLCGRERRPGGRASAARGARRGVMARSGRRGRAGVAEGVTGNVASALEATVKRVTVLLADDDTYTVPPSALTATPVAVGALVSVWELASDPSAFSRTRSTVPKPCTAAQ